ncbi:MAG: hypothetical protein RBR77_13190, partial [Thauera sp.]|nr:hypothetical protein [Thauera sp.]
DKRITDMKAVEGWLKMNLNMLQMSIQGLELQRATLAAVKAMGSDEVSGGNPFAAAAAMWQPWNLMAGAGAAPTATTGSTEESKPRSPRRKPDADSKQG